MINKVIFKIYSSDKLLEIKKSLKLLLIKNSYEISDYNYTHIIILGGDGTFLKACHDLSLYEKNIKIIPVNCGKLGFLLANKYSEIEEIILDFKKNSLIENNIPVFQMIINNKKRFHFINDVHFMNNPLPCKFNLNINDKIIKNNYMSGFLISTVMGSFAFNKSLNGPIYLFKDNILIFNPVAPINNLFYKTIINPLVIRDISNFKIEDITNSDALVIDGKLINIKNIKNITFSSKIKIVQTLSLKKETIVKGIVEKIL